MIYPISNNLNNDDPKLRKKQHPATHKNVLVATIGLAMFCAWRTFRTTATTTNQQLSFVVREDSDGSSPKNNHHGRRVVSPYTGRLIGSPLSQLQPSCQHKADYDFDKDETYLSSDANSIFNCNRTGGDDAIPPPLCNYHYPARFFDEDCGIGRNFSRMVRDAEAKRLNDTLWLNMPHMGYPTLTINNLCLTPHSTKVRRERHSKGDRSTNESKKVLTNIGESYRSSSNNNNDHRADSSLRCVTERVTHLHVHKAGGTTVRKVFTDYQRAFPGSAQLVRHHFFWPSMDADKKRTVYELAKTPLSRHATRYPSRAFAPEQHVAFATVRDPTERFVSSVGQALGGEGSRNNRIGARIVKTCFDDGRGGKETNATVALRCVVDYVATHGTWIELHFTPQALDIAFTTLWQDLPVAVFEFRYLPDILKYLGAEDTHARDGGKGKYRSVELLRNMTVDDYDEHSLRTVCELYEVDVIMQRSLGIEVPRCDKYIPR